MINVKSLCERLTRPVTVSGSEENALDVINEIKERFFDELVCDRAGNIILIRHAKSKNAKRILIDAHMDEVGFLVSDITDEGFLRVINVGGIDCKILQPCEVTVHADKEIYGVICSTPPHLKTEKKMPQIHELYIDTGYSKDDLERLGVRIGCAVSFRYSMTELKNGRLCGKGFDDKICIVCAVMASEMLDGCDIELAVMLSSREEIGKSSVVGAYNFAPDYAIVLDVTGAEIPEEKNTVYSSSSMGHGPEISVSAILEKNTVYSLISYAEGCDIPYSLACDGANTGTNANDIPTVSVGIPTVLMSIPLLNMHTYSEIIDVKDVEYTARLTAGFIKDVLVK